MKDAAQEARPHDTHSSPLFSPSSSSPHAFRRRRRRAHPSGRRPPAIPHSHSLRAEFRLIWRRQSAISRVASAPSADGNFFSSLNVALVIVGYSSMAPQAAASDRSNL